MKTIRIIHNIRLLCQAYSLNFCNYSVRKTAYAPGSFRDSRAPLPAADVHGFPRLRFLWALALSPGGQCLLGCTGRCRRSVAAFTALPRAQSGGFENHYIAFMRKMPAALPESPTRQRLCQSRIAAFRVVPCIQPPPPVYLSTAPSPRHHHKMPEDRPMTSTKRPTFRLEYPYHESIQHRAIRE